MEAERPSVREARVAEPRSLLTIARLGACTIPSPLRDVAFLDETAHVLRDSDLASLEQAQSEGRRPDHFDKAGPRAGIYFDPSKLKCGIVTCGGLCPGINDVIRSLVMSLHYQYGVRSILGFRYGYEGLTRRHGHAPVELRPEDVSHIHEHGGTILGSSRGPQDVGDMVDTLERMKIGILFTIGGDGTLRGAHALAGEIAARGLKIAVVGIPKTIDNDIASVQTSFGFHTAVSEARRATYAAHNEARGGRNGVGLVKLMGRDSGFIAAYATLADSQVNFCLIPESSFTLTGFLGALRERIERRGHAVIVVAEGAGHALSEAVQGTDTSGNVQYRDIGILLRESIREDFSATGLELNLKYIDPSYIIRSMPANAFDSAFCQVLGQSAAHAGMAGNTDLVVGVWNDQFTHVPIPVAVSERKKVDLRGWLWRSVLASTGQPFEML